MADELGHIRCISCGKVLGRKWDKYQKLLREGTSPQEAMKEIGLTRYCCKMWMQSPFKIPHIARQNETIEIRPTETLTVAVPPQQPIAPLQAMTGAPTDLAGKVVVKQMTIVPQETIGMPTLPGFQEVELPGIPTLAPEDATDPDEGGFKKDVTRCYISW